MIFQPTIFSPIIQYVALVHAKSIVLEVEDNFQKQTYRNRYYVYGANGIQMLNIPVIHAKGSGRIKTKDILIDRSFSWHKLHIKTLDAAYSSSPFYEFYKDDIISVVQKKHKYLLDLNLESLGLIYDCLQLEEAFEKSESYQLDYAPGTDLRYLSNAKSREVYALKKYTQVFNEKHGYISNLSILDLLFNEGPNALLYLEDHKDLWSD